jgi:pimeloyl-ACP methyl ester carboxylesterase
MQDVETPDYVITLIHGTWGRSSTWCEPGSTFCEQLLAALKPKRVLFTKFSWSGRNRPSERQKAADNLAATLKSLIQNQGAAKHFIVAHSHAGNVVCYSLRDHPELQHQICGVICLSTPFLYAERRDLAPLREDHFLSALSLVFMVLALTITGRFDLITIEVDRPLIGAAEIGMLLIGCGALGYWIGKWLAKTTGRLLTQIVAKLALPSGLRVPLCIVRGAGDEANAWLIASQHLTFVTTKLWICLIIPIVAWHNVLRAIRLTLSKMFHAKFLSQIRLPGAAYGMTAVLYILLTAITLRQFFGSAPLSDVHPLLSLSADVAMAILAVPIGYLIVFAGFLCIIFVIGIPFGIEVALSHIFLELDVEPTPPGSYLVHQFRLKSHPSGGVIGPLRHCLVYDDHTVIAAVGNWIAGHAD